MNFLTDLWQNETLNFVAAIYGNIYPMDLARYVIGAGGVYLVVNVLLSRRLAKRKIRANKPSGSQMLWEFAVSMRTVFVFAAAGLTIGLLERAGWLYILPGDGWLGLAWSVTSLIILIVLQDAWFFWTHWAMHKIKPIRRFHAVHHKSHNPSPWSAYSFNISEAAIQAGFFPLALLLVPSTELAIFGFVTHMILRNALGHCGYEVYPACKDGTPMFDWMTTTTHHDMHHAKPGSNFSLYFTWWDRWMGTEHPKYLEHFAQAVAKREPQRQSKVPVGAVGGMFLAAAVLGVMVSPGSATAEAPENISQSQISAAQAIAEIEGLWATQGHGWHVNLHACPDAPDNLCGTLDWVWDPEEKAATAIGDLMITDLVWNGEKWKKGKLVMPGEGTTYRGSITPIEGGNIELEGCTFIFCQDQVWRRPSQIPGCRALTAHSTH